MKYESSFSGLSHKAITKNKSQPPYIPFAQGTMAAPSDQRHARVVQRLGAAPALHRAKQHLQADQHAQRRSPTGLPRPSLSPNTAAASAATLGRGGLEKKENGSKCLFQQNFEPLGWCPSLGERDEHLTLCKVELFRARGRIARRIKSFPKQDSCFFHALIDPMQFLRANYLVRV
jgi:hypothetical protein